ncbi:wall-associated receptor kinase-like 20 [Bidens hawaiensis]|uniref:wall-associated receptor kinase-like 20 n=1 Tax=Bidens hawaiensis TaxID=980011 RepID=UPI0040499642
MPVRMLVLIMAVLIAHTGCHVAAIRCPSRGTTPVPYPLSTAPTCGHPSYKIRCDTGVLKFDTLNNTYLIISISPKDQRLVIAQSPFLPNTCVTADLPTQGIQLDPNLPFTISLNNTIIFFNCTETMSSLSMDCTPTSPCRAYENASPWMSVCMKSPRCCSYYKGSSTNLFALRLTMDRCRAYKSFVNLNSSWPFDKWLEPSVELMWAPPPEPPCTKQAHFDSTSTCRAALDGSRRCVCKSAFLWNAAAGQCVKDIKKVRRKRTVRVASTVCIGGTVFLTTISGMVIFIRRQKIKSTRKRLARERDKIIGASGIGTLAKIFTSKEIKRATNNFSASGLLSVGGFGEVYKGVMEDGTVVAVKCAKLGNTKSIDQVLNEVRILCQVNHKNLVHLLGCCVELEQPFLVYEYVPNGSLFDHLHDQNKQPLTWTQRLGIARDTAKGLAYLHFSASPPIYHRDVKSSNILLDYNMKAKVSDFGISRLAEADVTHVTTCAQGTFGYLDPEYYWNYQLTDKSDVYSFGVLLLEMLTCQKAIDFGRPAEDVNLVAYIKRLVKEERLVDAIDPVLKTHASSLDIDAMKAFGFLAMSCLEERRANRPSMKEISEEIEYIMGIVATTANDNSRES